MGNRTSKIIILYYDVIIRIIEYNPVSWCGVTKEYNNIAIDMIMRLPMARSKWESHNIMQHAMRNNNYEVLNNFLHYGFPLTIAKYNIALVGKLLQYEREVPIDEIIKYANTLEYKSAQHISICERLQIWLVPKRK